MKLLLIFLLLNDMLDPFFFGICLFIIALFGIFVVKNNIIIMLISLELLLLSLNIQFIVFSVYLDDLLGQIVSFILLTFAALESAIGLALLVAVFKASGFVFLNLLNSLKS